MNPQADGRDRALGGDRGVELTRVDADLEQLFPVDQDDGDSDPVLELERVVARDVHFVEIERRAGARREDDVASLVAQAAPRPRIHHDVSHAKAS